MDIRHPILTISKHSELSIRVGRTILETGLYQHSAKMSNDVDHAFLLRAMHVPLSSNHSD